MVTEKQMAFVFHFIHGPLLGAYRDYGLDSIHVGYGPFT